MINLILISYHISILAITYEILSIEVIEVVEVVEVPAVFGSTLDIEVVEAVEGIGET